MTSGKLSMTQPTEDIDFHAAAISGIAAAEAYAVAMQADLRLLRHNADDLIVLGRPLVGRRRRSWITLVGMLVHLFNGATLGIVYARFARSRLPGPSWLRGAIFANLENVILYPITILENHHPAIREGEIDRYWHPTAFLQSIPRHVVYRIVLCLVYERLRRPPSSSRYAKSTMKPYPLCLTSCSLMLPAIKDVPASTQL